MLLGWSGIYSMFFQFTDDDDDDDDNDVLSQRPQCLHTELDTSQVKIILLKEAHMAGRSLSAFYLRMMMGLGHHVLSLSIKTFRTNAGWRKWRQATRILCDHWMPLHLKSKIYRTVASQNAGQKRHSQQLTINILLSIEPALSKDISAVVASMTSQSTIV
uniref:Uncharacterized protein n=1 Tax=Micrurus corallinus TaxID=54390 RepID=A0A2D4G352_MICCO